MVQFLLISIVFLISVWHIFCLVHVPYFTSSDVDLCKAFCYWVIITPGSTCWNIARHLLFVLILLIVTSVTINAWVFYITYPTICLHCLVLACLWLLWLWGLADLTLALKKCLWGLVASEIDLDHEIERWATKGNWAREGGRLWVIGSMVLNPGPSCTRLSHRVWLFILVIYLFIFLVTRP